jgi:hypothetical protein
MRFALVVLFLAILSFGGRPAKAQQFVVTGRLESSNGSPGGYPVELYIDTVRIESDKTNPDGSYAISKKYGIDPVLIRSSNVICYPPGKYAHSPVDFQRTDLGYRAHVPQLKLLSTEKKKYEPEEARETIRVLVTVQAILFSADKISTSQLKIIEAIRVLDKTNLPPAKRRAIVDNLRLDPTLHSDVVNEFRKYLAP